MSAPYFRSYQTLKLRNDIVTRYECTMCPIICRWEKLGFFGKLIQFQDPKSTGEDVLFFKHLKYIIKPNLFRANKTIHFTNTINFNNYCTSLTRLARLSQNELSWNSQRKRSKDIVKQKTELSLYNLSCIYSRLEAISATL